MLRTALGRPAPPQQILIFGPAGTGKREAARRVAWALADPDRSHEPDEISVDIDLLLGSGHLIRREDLEPAIFAIHTKPLVAKRRVLVIDEAHRLEDDQAASQLLRTLEEPPPRSHIVLVTSRIEELLPTLRSRCAPVPFRHPGRAAVAARRDEIESQLLDLGVELGRSALAGQEAVGSLVAGIEARMEATADATPSTGLLELRARAAELEGKRGARTAAKRADDQARRERRKAVTDGWEHVLGGLAGLTRDVLAAAVGSPGDSWSGLPADEVAAITDEADPETLIAALDAIVLARSELWLNPRTDLAAEALVAKIRALRRGERPPLVSVGRLPY